MLAWLKPYLTIVENLVIMTSQRKKYHTQVFEFVQDKLPFGKEGVGNDFLIKKIYITKLRQLVRLSKMNSSS